MLTYNREEFVGRAIRSILGQTLRDFEFIIVDNGSTDQSGAIADSYAKIDKRIQVIHRERGNIGCGRNTGLDVAVGEYIAFIDDDDYTEPDYLEFLYNLSVDNNADVAICGADRVVDGEFFSGNIFNDILLMNTEEAIITLMWRKRYNNGFPTKLFRRALFDGLRFPVQGRYDDIYLMYKVLANANSVISFGLPKYHICRHSNNNSAPTTNDGLITVEYLEEYRKAYRERTKWLCKRFPSQSEYWWYFDWSFQISMVNKIASNNLDSCKKHLYEMCQELKQHRREFLSSPYILDFERKWMDKYV